MFDYLKPFISPKEHTGILFYPVKEEELLQAEKRLGFEFPSQLRQFYLEIGEGTLCRTANQTKNDYFKFSGSNDILSPTLIAKILVDREHLESDEAISPDLTFKPGELPFFEIADGSQFLIMRPLSDNPNAVYDMCNVLIEDSFEQFIWKLYYERPDFYSYIGTQEHYEDLLTEYIRLFGEEKAHDLLKGYIIRAG